MTAVVPAARGECTRGGGEGKDARGGKLCSSQTNENTRICRHVAAIFLVGLPYFKFLRILV